MNKRLTLVGLFDDNSTNLIESYTNDKMGLCKVPFGRNVDRFKADTMPYHVTILSWPAECKDLIIETLNKMKLDNFKILINGIDIMNGKENSYVLYFSIESNEKLKKLQDELLEFIPCEKFNPLFHITIDIDKDYNKIINLKKDIECKFKPFEVNITKLGIFEIWPPKLVNYFVLEE